MGGPLGLTNKELLKTKTDTTHKARHDSVTIKIIKKYQAFNHLLQVDCQRIVFYSSSAILLPVTKHQGMLHSFLLSFYPNSTLLSAL